jgi:nucleoid-associated protein YgaU
MSTIRPAQPKPAANAATVATQKSVTVQRGDSLWKLAQQTLGRGNRFPELLAVNPSVVNPNQIRAGAQLLLPVLAASGPKSSSALSNAGKTIAEGIKVHKGDTLWALAKSNLGRASAWTCLAAANPSIGNPNRIYEGQILVLPAACSSASATPAFPLSRSSASRP